MADKKVPIKLSINLKSPYVHQRSHSSDHNTTTTTNNNNNNNNNNNSNNTHTNDSNTTSLRVKPYPTTSITLSPMSHHGGNGHGINSSSSSYHRHPNSTNSFLNTTNHNRASSSGGIYTPPVDNSRKYGGTTKVATPVRYIEESLCNAFIDGEDSDDTQTPCGKSIGAEVEVEPEADAETDTQFLDDDSDSATPPFFVPSLASKEQADKVEAQQLLDSIMNNAERLHEFHKQYRIQYAAKEKFASDYQSTTFEELKRRLEKEIQEVNKQMNDIICNMYNFYQKMLDELDKVTKYPLDADQDRSVQSYRLFSEDFGKTQAHLIQAGAQQISYQQRGLVTSPHYPAATTPHFGYMLYQMSNGSTATNTTVATNPTRGNSGASTTPLATVHNPSTTATGIQQMRLTAPPYGQSIISQSMTPHPVNTRAPQGQFVAPHSAPRGSRAPVRFDFGHVNSAYQHQAVLAANQHVTKIAGGVIDKIDNSRYRDLISPKQRNITNALNSINTIMNSINPTTNANIHGNTPHAHIFDSNQYLSSEHTVNSNNSNDAVETRSEGANGSDSNNGIDKQEKLSEATWNKIRESMDKLLATITVLTSEVKSISARVCKSLSNVMKGDDYFKDGKVVAYGASEQDLFLKDSNYNFCFSSRNLQLKPADAIQLMADLMKKHTVFDKVQCVPRNNDGRSALSFVDTKTSAKCELVINMPKEIGASRYIGAYSSIDPRFRALAILIKYWAQQKKLGGPQTTKGLPSYVLILLVINYLQRRRVLPVISTAMEESGESEWGRRDDYEINLTKYREYASKQNDFPASLLLGFFYYFGFEFDYQNQVVSVRTGSALKKTEKKWLQCSKKNQALFAIEDPLDSSCNLGRMVDKNLLQTIRHECAKTYRRLYETQDINCAFAL